MIQFYFRTPRTIKRAYSNPSKANALVNTAIEGCTINKLGIVVLDELHMINDDFRG